ncbi:MAG: hypothetical protein P8Y25_10695 [Chromatiaceae bacterium]|jgi:hypothetical protein
MDTEEAAVTGWAQERPAEVHRTGGEARPEADPAAGTEDAFHLHAHPHAAEVDNEAFGLTPERNSAGRSRAFPLKHAARRIGTGEDARIAAVETRGELVGLPAQPHRLVHIAGQHGGMVVPQLVTEEGQRPIHGRRKMGGFAGEGAGVVVRIG